MYRRKWIALLWLLLAIGSLWFFVAFGYALNIGISVTEPTPPATSEPPQITNGYKIVSIGDSIAKGTGDESGSNIGERLAPVLSTVYNREVTPINLAVDGFTIQELSTMLQTEDTRAQLRDANVIYLSIGGNDLKSLWFIETSAQEEAFNQKLATAKSDILPVLESLEQLSPKGIILFTGLYPLSMDKSQNQYIVRWNNAMALLALDFNQVRFLPTFDLFEMHLDKYLSTDGLHPNTIGYDAIGNRIQSLLLSK